MEDFRADQQGAPLETPSGRIETFSETIASCGYDDSPGHPSWLEPAEWLLAAEARRYPLHLLSHQPETKLHSQYDLGPHCEATRPNGRELLRLHPEDAGARGIADGDIVRVWNDRGACLVEARLDLHLLPRVRRCRPALGSILPRTAR
jgi:biotin/methionine sulfoxide reductase